MDERGGLDKVLESIYTVDILPRRPIKLHARFFFASAICLCLVEVLGYRSVKRVIGTWD